MGIFKKRNQDDTNVNVNASDSAPVRERRKWDIVAASRTKKYKIIAGVILVVGLLCMGIGLLMRGNTTPTKDATWLDVEFSGRSGIRPNYSGIITDPATGDYLYLLVDTKTGKSPLINPIEFELDDDAAAFLQPIETSHYMGYFPVHLRDDVELVDGMRGNLTVRCGNLSVRITFTFEKTA